MSVWRFAVALGLFGLGLTLISLVAAALEQG